LAKLQDIRNRTPFGNPTRKLSDIKYIVRHYSATESGNFDTFYRHWKGKGWITGGYHEIILRDGTVQLCYNPEQVTNGVRNYNTPCYHICLVGLNGFTEAQEKAWDERVAYNMERLNIDVNRVKGHQEMPGANTECPGIDMDTVRARIKVDKNKDNNKDKLKPSEPKPYTQDAKWPKLENYGPNVKKVQQLLVKVGYNIKVDSSFGPATDKAVRDFQKKHGLAVDGQAGPQTQSKLKEVTSKPTLKITGKLDKPTIKALQQRFGTTVDGIISKPKSLLVTAMQKWLGTKQDGIISKPKSNMVKALQRKLGMDIVDGVISTPYSNVVAELQRRINKGTL